ncbi:hypothetical protein [Massilia sp. NR 4-1]|uniref:hypothetical protein n=1 Tax=Massilia sp. NR 4-1 TaxID=1678028 RepID=UPI00067D3537|nr:hypothetical protein [Massilia sp. NR 4-1]AKU23447.1 hypothetical protein ACZ75_20285 [Massilia sp. NR 4-1]
MKTTHPFTPWLALGQAALTLLEENEVALPARQAALAQQMKAALEAGRQWNDLQAAACTSLLHFQLGLYPPRQAMDGLQALTALQGELAAQQKQALQKGLERAGACSEALLLAQNQDDVTIVLSGFADAIGTQLRAEAEQLCTLLNSAGSAATVLTHKALDDWLAAAPAPAPAAEA